MKFHTIKSDLWEDEAIRKISKDAIYLFLYLFTNRRCPPSGIYKLSIESLVFESRLSENQVDDLLEELKDNNLIAHDSSKNAFWIVGKIKHHKVNFKDYITVKSILNDIQSFVGACWYQSFFIKYPQFTDCAIELEALKEIRYHKHKEISYER